MKDKIYIICYEYIFIICEIDLKFFFLNSKFELIHYYISTAKGVWIWSGPKYKEEL